MGGEDFAVILCFETGIGPGIWAEKGMEVLTRVELLPLTFIPPNGNTKCREIGREKESNMARGPGAIHLSGRCVLTWSLRMVGNRSVKHYKPALSSALSDSNGHSHMRCNYME